MESLPTLDDYILASADKDQPRMCFVPAAGGNTVNMLAIWRLHGLEGILKDAYEAGVVLAVLALERSVGLRGEQWPNGA